MPVVVGNPRTGVCWALSAPVCEARVGPRMQYSTSGVGSLIPKVILDPLGGNNDRDMGVGCRGSLEAMHHQW